MEAAGSNTDLRAETEFAAIGKLRRCIVQHDGRIDLVEKSCRSSFVLGHDRIGVMRAVGLDVGDRGSAPVCWAADSEQAQSRLAEDTGRSEGRRDLGHPAVA